MREKIQEEETDKIIKYAIENPDMTVEEISKKFDITHQLAFYIVSEAGKKLNNLK
jgi:predicted HTH transcriptional regulator